MMLIITRRTDAISTAPQIAVADLDTIADGYESCPLTIEKGRIVLAEFGFGGKLLPRLSSWILKKYILPSVYWDLMRKGREWLARPSISK
jgi:sulfide:quinone oxidoreductase